MKLLPRQQKIPPKINTFPPVAAKHVETLQRSNEQLVKIITLRQKRQVETLDLSDDDKNSLFDMIQGDT